MRALRVGGRGGRKGAWGVAATAGKANAGSRALGVGACLQAKVKIDDGAMVILAQAARARQEAAKKLSTLD